MSPDVRLKKYEYAIPMEYVHQFQQEARFIWPGSLVGVWVFPPDFVTKLGPELAKEFANYTIVAIPNKILER